MNSNENSTGPGTSWSDWFRKSRIDRYFLEERCPYSGKRKFKTTHLKWCVGVLVSACVAGILYFGDNVERTRAKSEAVSVKSGDVPTGAAVVNGNAEGGIAVGGSWSAERSHLMSSPKGYSSGSGSNRQYGASQIVRNTGMGAGFGLPMGTTLQVRLVNTILSSDSNQPVIAEVVEDAVWRNSVLIPMGARAMGGTSFDEVSQRLQIRFHTLVYPEGDQHAVQAIALLGNGSSGIPGEYHSGATKKEIGRFIGNFVGGVAEGMKEGRGSGPMGIRLDSGSIKDGLLNGITVGSLDQAKSFSEGMQNVRPYMEVEKGTSFLLYLEKEYSP